MTSEKRTKSDPHAVEDARYRILIEAVTDYALYMLDTKGFVATWNPGAARLKQYQARDIIGQNFSLFFTEEDRRAGRPQRLLEIAGRVGRHEDEGWRVRKDGTRFWAFAVIDAIYQDGKLTGFAKITRDMTDRRLAQEALLESDRRFRLLVEGVTDCAIFMLDPQGVVNNWNPGAQRIKQYSANEIVGQHFSHFYTPEDQRNGVPAKALETARTTGKYEAEGWRMRKDGTQFWASVVIDAIRDRDGKLIGFAKITRDITERKDAQRALDETREQLFQAQKLDAVGQLTGGVAHDFNNLLGAILSGVALLDRAAGNLPRAKKILDMMRHAINRGQNLTQQLLTFARRQPMQPENIRLQDRLQTTLNILDRLLGTNIRVVSNIPPTLWPVTIDPNQFELALINVCLNARDAMPEGGTLTISARNEPLGSEGGTRYVALSITDTGMGIRPEIRSKVFEPFFTTKDIGKGSGLGLSQAYGFAKQSGGDITLESEVGVGTTMTFHLPSLAQVAPSTGAQEHPSGDASKILVVEDDEALAELTVALFENAGFAVTVAHSAVAALQLLRHGTKVDAIFSDVMMPGGMNGFELASTVRQDYPGLPIVLTTGFSDAADAARTKGVEVVAKPYDPEKVAAHLMQLIASSRGSTLH